MPVIIVTDHDTRELIACISETSVDAALAALEHREETQDKAFVFVDVTTNTPVENSDKMLSSGVYLAICEAEDVKQVDDRDEDDDQDYYYGAGRDTPQDFLSDLMSLINDHPDVVDVNEMGDGNSLLVEMGNGDVYAITISAIDIN